MRIKKDGMPEKGDVVLATVTRITPHAAFVRLEEYDGWEGIIHISEVAKTWVKNIKTHLRENQQVVAKVIDSDPRRRFAHLSIRRLSDYDRKAKWEQIKRQKRVENILELLSERLGISFEEIYKKLKKLEEEYGELYFAFEEVKKHGEKVLQKKVPKAWIPELVELIDRSISLPEVEIVANLEIKSIAGDGVERINKLLKILQREGVEVIYLGAPKFRVSLKGIEAKEVANKLRELLEKVQKAAGKTEQVSFEIEKKRR